MRDLFSVGRDETSVRDDKLEILMNQILKLQNQISSLVEQQQRDRELILEQQKTLENRIENQRQEASIIQQQSRPQQTIEEDNYIMLEEEPEEPRISIVEERYVDPLEKEIVRSIAKNKKTIIKQKILGIAAKQRITAKHVKELIVDKYRYCSKATFYRYLSELKRQQKIETITVNNKEYVCNVSIDRKNQF